MKKILFITNGLGFGGAEKMLAFVANKLSERGNICYIVNLDVAGEYANAKMQKINDDVIVHVFDNKNAKHKRLSHLKFITRIAKSAAVDIIIGFTGFPNFYASVVGSLLKIPSIMSERGDPKSTEGKYKVKAKILNYFVNKSTGGVFQTDGARNYFGENLRKNGVVIPNPIFVNCEIPPIDISERSKTVVSVGRFDNVQKRYDIMLKSFAIFLETHPGYVLKLYGEGPDKTMIEEFIGSLSISENVKFMGVSNNPMHDIAYDGMFVISSDFEGISNSLLEAMAIGLPCVSTDHPPGGARMLIKDRINGLLVPVRDPIAFSKAMGEFADNNELSRVCSKNAKTVTTRFAPDAIIDAWENYIIKLTNG